MTTTISAILVFFVIVLIHELGHFIVAKSVGIKVHEFSIGMGPRIYKFGKGETVYSIRLIPIGGYVRMEGEDEESNDARSFGKKSILARMGVVIAGPLMNFVLAIIIYSLITMMVGGYTTSIANLNKDFPEYKAGLRSGDKIVEVNDTHISTWEQYLNEINEFNGDSIEITVIREDKKLDFNIKPAMQNFIGITPKFDESIPTTIIASVDSSLPAAKAGLIGGDKIISINDYEINTWEDIKTQINGTSEKEIKLTILRNNEIKVFYIEPVKRVVMGISTEIRKSVAFSIKTGFQRTLFYLSMMIEFFINLFKGQINSGDISGPVGVINLVGEAAKLGIVPLLSLAGFISINLGFFNLLPIPALDGSRLFFLIIEAFRGKAIDSEKEGFIHFIGFAFLIMLMIFVTYKDIAKLNLFR